MYTALIPDPLVQTWTVTRGPQCQGFLCYFSLQGLVSSAAPCIDIWHPNCSLFPAFYVTLVHPTNYYMFSPLYDLPEDRTGPLQCLFVKPVGNYDVYPRQHSQVVKPTKRDHQFTFTPTCISYECYSPSNLHYQLYL